MTGCLKWVIFQTKCWQTIARRPNLSPRFCMAQGLSMAFTFLNGWKKNQKENLVSGHVKMMCVLCMLSHFSLQCPTLCDPMDFS